MSRGSHAFVVGLLLAMLLMPTQINLTPEHSTKVNSRSVNDLHISEILVSASSADFEGVDWNGDGVIGSTSDQFIELWNSGDVALDVSDFILDDTTDAGSPPCRLAWNTTIEPNGRIVVFRADSHIELDYFEADQATISDASGNLIDALAYPAQDSWWDWSYVRLENGTVTKQSPPTPGWNDGGNQTDQRMIRCYGMNDHLHDGSYILQGRIVTMNDATDVMNDGMILIENGMITAVWDDLPPSTVDITDVPIYQTNGSIYPGFIDLHNHLHYNQAPLWDMETHLPLAQQNQWGGYNNRYEWKNHPDYSDYVTRPKNLVHSGPFWNMEIQAMKYIEMKSIVGGTTAAQGSPTNPDDAYASILARNIEDYNFGRDQIHTKVTELTSDYVGSHIINGNASGTLDAWFVHIAEGVDEQSRAEFDILVNNNLLVGELVLIHGVALGQAEFEQMASVGATLVWSPLSNLLLYGQTADVAAAKAAGVRLTLAPDWSPSGSKSPLHELKVADLWDDEILGDIFTDYELVRMISQSAAQATGWSNDVGTLTAGTAADLVVLDNIHADPYRNVINAVDPDVRLSIVGGLPLYGDEDLMRAMNGDDIEPAGAFNKYVDVTFQSVQDGMQSWASIVDNLTMAMHFDQEAMQSAFGDATDFENVVNGMPDVGLDPWYTYGDTRYFDVLNRSSNANAQIDMSLLYSRYYDRDEQLNPVTELSQNFSQSLCSDGAYPPCEIETQPELNNTEGNNSTIMDQNLTQVNDASTEALGDDEDPSDMAFLTLVAVVLVIVGGLIVISKSGDSTLREEVTILSISKGQADGASYIPSPPPHPAGRHEHLMEETAQDEGEPAASPQSFIPPPPLGGPPQA